VKECPVGSRAYFSRCFHYSDKAEETAKAFYDASGFGDIMHQLWDDVRLSWLEIIYMTLIALALSIVMTLLFRFFAGVIVYIILVLAVLSCLAVTGFMWAVWYKKKDYFENKLNGTSVEGQNLDEESVGSRIFKAESQKEVNQYLTAAIVASIVTVRRYFMGHFLLEHFLRW